jgi:C-terminal processing protease CtpA/Prc
MGPPYLRTLRDSAYLSEIPKFFLIDDGARSGKELVAGIVKRAGLGTLVGSTTAGYYLGGSPFRLFDEKYFVYVAVGGGSPIPGIGVIEGIGIEPDIAVLPCRTYCGGHDPQLGRALELIGELG